MQLLAKINETLMSGAVFGVAAALTIGRCVTQLFNKHGDISLNVGRRKLILALCNKLARHKTHPTEACIGVGPKKIDRFKVVQENIRVRRVKRWNVGEQDGNTARLVNQFAQSHELSSVLARKMCGSDENIV